MSTSTLPTGLSSPTVQPLNMFGDQTKNTSNIGVFNKQTITRMDLDNNSKRTRLGKHFDFVGSEYGDVLSLEVDTNNNVQFSRKEITLRFSPTNSTSESAYKCDFTVGPNSSKTTLYEPVTNFLLELFTKVINPWLPEANRFTNDFLNACKTAIVQQASTPNYKSTVVTTVGATAVERYSASRLLRFCDKMVSAILSEAENVWTFVEKKAKQNGATSVNKSKKGINSGKSELEKTIEKYRKDAAHQETRDVLVNNKEMEVKTKAMRQFCSLLYVTPGEILETKIWYAKALDEARRKVAQTQPSAEVNTDLTKILNVWVNYSRINKACGNANSDIYFPEVPFYVIDAVGIWDISKSEKNPTFKPVSLSSITALRMPYLMGYNWQGNAINGDEMAYVLISSHIDREITKAKRDGLNALEQAIVNIASELFHFKNYPLPSLKRARYREDKSIREYERELGGNAPDEPVGPSLQYAQHFPPTQNTNRVAQKFRETEDGAKFFNDTGATYMNTLRQQQAQQQLTQH
mgnify:CR=1 FL=1